MLDYARDFLREWREDRVPDLAAEVAFYAILSLLPAMISFAAFMSVLGSIAGSKVAADTEAEVVDFLNSVLTSEAEGTIDAVTALFADRQPGLLTFSLLLTMWALSRGFAALVRALDVVYDLDEHRSWIATRVTALALAVGSAISGTVLIALLVVGPLLGTGQEVADTVGFGDTFALLWDVLRLPLAFVFLVLWSATIFHIAPDHSTPWRADVPGAIATTVLWVIFTGGLRLYLASPAATESVYGALGGVLIVLLWFWLLSLAVMIGGQINALALARASNAVEGGPEPGDELAGVDGAAAVEQDAHDGRRYDHPV